MRIDGPIYLLGPTKTFQSSIESCGTCGLSILAGQVLIERCRLGPLTSILLNIGNVTRYLELQNCLISASLPAPDCRTDCMEKPRSQALCLCIGHKETAGLRIEASDHIRWPRLRSTRPCLRSPSGSPPRRRWTLPGIEARFFCISAITCFGWVTTDRRANKTSDE